MSVDTVDFFQAFPKIPRLHRGITITEKIDGTNAAVGVIVLEDTNEEDARLGTVVEVEDASYLVYAQSRTRIIVPGKDNYGFALWVSQHATELAGLGVGLHFGEWWGVGINRAYDIHERRFSLFNTSRWGAESETQPPACCSVVPVLDELDALDTPRIMGIAGHLEHTGSQAAPGFKKPEGIVVYHKAANSCFKYTFDGDGHKSDVKKTRRENRGGS